MRTRRSAEIRRPARGGCLRSRAARAFAALKRRRSALASRPLAQVQPRSSSTARARPRAAHPPRLQHQHRPAAASGRRQARRLPPAWRATTTAARCADRVDDGVVSSTCLSLSQRVGGRMGIPSVVFATLGNRARSHRSRTQADRRGPSSPSGTTPHILQNQTQWGPADQRDRRGRASFRATPTQRRKAKRSDGRKRRDRTKKRESKAERRWESC